MHCSTVKNLQMKNKGMEHVAIYVKVDFGFGPQTVLSFTGLHCIKLKGKVFDAHSMKASMGSNGMAILFFTLALNRVMWLTSCPGHSTSRKEPQYPLNKMLGGPQSQSGHFVEQSLVPSRNQTWIIQPIH